MSETKNILVAGFGGQGVLFGGKFMVYTGMMADKQVSWLPSYGPEMRGGTANCSVIISEQSIGSPIVKNPNVLIVMNGPSLDLFENNCVPGGTIVLDSSLIPRKVNRTDVNAFYIPATQMADEEGLKGLANMIIIGKAVRAADICGMDELEAAMRKTVPERKKDMFDANMRAVTLGYEYK